MNTVTVTAAPGLRVPTEKNPRKYITGTTTVPSTAYYLRRIASGELVEVAPKTTPAPRSRAAQ